ncbi:hypothetical protein EXM90_11475 [Clostridium botulinum]|uniref:hypothetical protein n=1 Tax=Clostridium botulinum TaxID=1491 RepID=UPI000773AC4D|nr:hypothetical protein [Clostridium botulinum]AUN01429.1 hypothetical protein RSJ19_00160 [Clostridium botulinum]MBN3367234.1 hypothetical protein [Clostridium botulinum]MBN3371618.1 hypothetical protein [Clostridium botulinum]MBN3376440.1 hypothetical protein [Clostridium botulinum]MBN3384233.1 hypothetical protein [Clostridium botulinum]
MFASERKIKFASKWSDDSFRFKSGDTYFEFGIDIIDLKSEDVSNDHKKIIRNLVKNKVYTQNFVNRV